MGRETWTLCALAVVFLTATRTGWLAAADHTPGATLSAPELRAKLSECLQRIRSFRVVYRSYGYDPERFPAGTYLHRVVVAKAPYSLYHVSAHGHDALDWHDDYYQQRAYITRDHLYNEFPVNRSYFDHEMKPSEGLPGTLPGEFFFLATGIWPLTAREPPRPDGRPYMLSEVAASEEYSIVRPRQELVDGRWCHVLERPGYDRLWIDAERGCALLARETHSQLNGAMVQRIELGDHQEIKPGIWMPKTMRNVQYDWLCPDEAGRKRIVLDGTFRILEIGVNDVEDEIFQFDPQAGALLDNGVNRPRQVREGGLDHLDDLLLWARKNASVPSISSGATSRWWALVPALLVMAACEFARFGRKLFARQGNVEKGAAA